MVFYIIVFCISILIFLAFADKKRFWAIVPTCYLAMILALLSDLLMFVYPLWEYPSSSKIGLFWKQMMHAFGIYPVVTYLFIQSMPSRQTIFTVLKHVFVWSLIAIAVEWVYLLTGHIIHGLWWNLWCSYIADWLLYFIFYFHYRRQILHQPDKRRV